MKNLSTIEKLRLQKINNYQENNINPFLDNVKPTISFLELIKKYQSKSREELENEISDHKISGRLIGIRGPFYILKSGFENLQVYVGKDFKSDHQFLFSNLDIGDIVIATGKIMKTKIDTLALKASEFQLVTKSVKVLPEKFHGLKDSEIRYRNRYLDLIVNNDVREVFLKRSKIIKTIRSFFDNLNYLEVETPVLQNILGGALAKPFITHHNTFDEKQYLRIATELPLKKLLVGGFERVYEIGRLFRNEGVDTTHNPEFTTIEFYEAFGNIESMMKRTEDLIKHLIKELDASHLENLINDKKQFQRLNMVETLNQKLGINIDELNFDEMLQVALKNKIDVKQFYKKGHLVNELFENLIEESLVEPTFVWGHPIEVSPLAKEDPNHKGYTLRAELFINQKEYANLFSELNDPIEQLKRFESQISEKNQGNHEASEIDDDFINSLMYGMPPAGGCGIGIDRLVMLLTNQNAIRDVILFPHLRSKKNDK